MLGIRAVNTQDVGIANTTPGLKMKLRYEATADKSDTEFVRQPCNLLEPGSLSKVLDRRTITRDENEEQYF
jgi:hypothetical protein